MAKRLSFLWRNASKVPFFIFLFLFIPLSCPLLTLSLSLSLSLTHAHTLSPLIFPRNVARGPHQESHIESSCSARWSQTSLSAVIRARDERASGERCVLPFLDRIHMPARQEREEAMIEKKESTFLSFWNTGRDQNFG